jgi:hypothetical protein
MEGGAMTRPTTPEGICAEAEEFAKKDLRRHRENGVDLNPFSTVGARDEWQRGFEGLDLLNYQGLPDYNTFYQRGRAAARLLKET